MSFPFNVHVVGDEVPAKVDAVEDLRANPSDKVQSPSSEVSAPARPGFHRLGDVINLRFKTNLPHNFRLLRLALYRFRWLCRDSGLLERALAVA